MSEPRPNENVDDAVTGLARIVPTPPPRDLMREARRLARMQRLRLVAEDSHVDRVRPTDGPKEAA